MPSVPPPSLSRTSSIADSSTSQNAALVGANIAFLGHPASKPASLRSSHTGASRAYIYPDAEDGSWSAAARSRSPSFGTSAPRSPLPRASSRSGAMSAQEQRAAMDLDTLRLAPRSEQALLGRSKSPSHQAAVLAAARAPPPSQPPSRQQRGRSHAGAVSKAPPPVAPKPRTLSGTFSNRSSVIEVKKPTDDTHIPPTTSLVDLFEKRMKESVKPEKRPEPILIKPSGDLTLKSPKPVRSGGITSMLRLQLEDSKSQNAVKKVNTDPAKASPTRPREDVLSSDDSFASASEALSPRDSLATSPLAPPRRFSQTLSPSSGQKKLQTENDAKRRPTTSPSPLRSSASRPIEINPPKRTGTAQSEALSISSSHSLRTIPAQFNQAYPRRLTPLTTGDELANALVASSLASSRAPSPMKEAPPVPTRRRKGQHHHKFGFSRTPSPTKTGMLKTLRKAQDEDVSSDEDEQNEQHPYGHHRKKRLIRKHPNKHHEGDRKRWRDAVTERERKRYEGVWAANKGLHYTFTPEEERLFRRAPHHPPAQQAKSAATEQVSNIVVKEIWNRSRLPENVLEMVWSLVDNDCVGRLHKEEFVVGMWLIDQRLKGRKLPTKVTDSVWASVRGISGIKVKVKK